ncbi:MAG: ligase-associated DNA damage response endonuclease PdeM [Caulobacteraceae bacterium]
MDLAGEGVVCRPSGGLWLAAHGVLVVADLHLEKGSSFAARGQMLPPYDTGETLRRLEAEVAALLPRVLVLLGDSFHDRGAEARLTGADRRRLLALASGRTLVWVAGNHDAAAPADLAGDTAAAVAFGGLVLVHEPRAGAPAGHVAGHLHPCARVAARAASVRRRCFVTDGLRMILPAFGAYAGGLNVRDPVFRPLMDAAPLAVVLGASRAHPIGWRSLRGD